MGKDILVVAIMAMFGTLFFSLIIGFSVILIPIPFLLLVIPLCLAGQLVFALKIDDIAEFFGYKFHE